MIYFQKKKSFVQVFQDCIYNKNFGIMVVEILKFDLIKTLTPLWPAETHWLRPRNLYRKLEEVDFDQFLPRIGFWAGLNQPQLNYNL